MQIVPAHLPKPPDGRTLVLAAGKAACSMALAVEKAWPEDKKLVGIALTRYGHGLELDRIRYVEAGHPVPDEAGETAAREMLAAARAIKPMDMMLALLSGGGSALLSLPVDGVTIADLRAVTRDLLKSGAAIQEINTVRKHLSQIQGGRLAAACHPARVVNLLLSDVPGDDAIDIASGPTVADATTCADALNILRRYRVQVPQRALDLLESGEGETLKPGDPRLPSIETRFVATPQMALEAAACVARDAGLPVHILGDAIEGLGQCCALGAGGVRTVEVGVELVLLHGGQSSSQIWTE